MPFLSSEIMLDVIASRPAASSAGRLFFASDTGALYRDNGSSWDAVTAGGSVTSVGLSMPGDFSVSGSPVTGSGTLTVTGGVTKSAIQQESYTYAADAGAANAYAVTLSPAPTIVAGSYVVFKAANANTGASTLAVNGGSATAIKKQGATALASGDIASGQIIAVVYDGTNFQLVGGGGSGGSGMTNPMTTTGDLIVGGSSGTPGRLAAATSGYVLTANGAGVAPTWQAASGGSSVPSLFTLPSTAPGITKPPTLAGGGWTWLNQATANAFDVATGIYMTRPASSTVQLSCLYQSAPATPYTLTVGLIPVLFNAATMGAGIGWTDGTKIAPWYFRNDSISAEIWSTATAGPAVYSDIVLPGSPASWVPASPQLVWLQIKDDGTNRICLWSLDGYNFKQFDSRSRVQDLTPSHICILIRDENATYPITSCFVSWVITSP